MNLPSNKFHTLFAVTSHRSRGSHGLRNMLRGLFMTVMDCYLLALSLAVLSATVELCFMCNLHNIYDQVMRLQAGNLIIQVLRLQKKQVTILKNQQKRKRKPRYCKVLSRARLVEFIISMSIDGLSPYYLECTVLSEKIAKMIT